MRCPNCRCVIPEASIRCQYCGRYMPIGSEKTLPVSESTRTVNTPYIGYSAPAGRGARRDDGYYGGYPQEPVRYDPAYGNSAELRYPPYYGGYYGEQYPAGMNGAGRQPASFGMFDNEGGITPLGLVLLLMVIEAGLLIILLELILLLA